MIVEVSAYLSKEYKEIEVEPGVAVSEVYEATMAAFPDLIQEHPVAARYNNELVDLNHAVTEPGRIIILDVRDQAANLIYQHSLTLIYLKAIEETLGRTPVIVENSLGKGLYTLVKRELPITQLELNRIERRMREIVAEDIPFVRKECGREEAIRLVENAGLDQKRRLIDATPYIDQYPFYELDGCINFFYGLMVPSTRYIYDFKIRKYMRGIMLMHPYKMSPKKAQTPELSDDRKLYGTFKEARRWQEAQDIYFVHDLNQKVVEGQSRDMIQLSEALHLKNIVKTAERILRERKRLILIAGPSSSGKTTFAKRLCTQLQVEGVKPLYLGTDDYFVERVDTPLDEKGEPNYENLDAVDVELFNRNMNDLLQGKEVDLPVFDFMEGVKKFGTRITRIEKNQPIVIEGIHALNNELTPYIKDKEKFRIYISPLTMLSIDNHNRVSLTDARMIRRIVRDSQFRGHPAQETIKTWPKVRAGEDKNVFPYNSKADVFFNSAHIYELCVLKKYAEPLLLAIGKDSEQYSEACRLLDFLRFFTVIEQDELIPNNSILREFIGGSVYV